MSAPRLREHPDELQALTQVVAEESGIPIAFIEKDFWAIEVLRVASADRPISQPDGSLATVRFAFKGGTSLSRVFGIIDRFSEDIDLLVLFPDLLSTGARERSLKAVQDDVRQHLNLEVGDVSASQQTKGIKRAVRYSYRGVASPNDALSEGVLLEMGSRGGDEPLIVHSLRSLVAEYAIERLGDSPEIWEEFSAFRLNVLGPERTLLEKLSAVHTACADATAISDRLSQHGRHFYDIHRLLESEHVRDRLGQLGVAGVEKLAEDIHSRGIDAGWASVPRPKEGYASSPAFSDAGDIGRVVRDSYEKASNLIYGEPITIEECLASVRRYSQLI